MYQPNLRRIVSFTCAIAVTSGMGLLAQQCCTGSVSSYCTAGVSVQGCVPSIAATGIPNVDLLDGFEIKILGVPGQRYGTIFYGFYSYVTPWAPGSPSFKCIANPVQRMGNAFSGGTAGQCDGDISADFNSWMNTHPGALGAPFVQGQTIRAQGWYRDPAAPAQTNLSNALQFTICSGTFDTTPPVIGTCANDALVSAAAGTCLGAVPDLRGQVVATDNCSTVTVTQVPPPGTQVSIGVMPVVLRARDESGNAVTCAATLTVLDSTAPVIVNCAPPQAVQAAACQTTVPDFTGTVSAYDSCGGAVSLSQSPPAGALVSWGDWPVVITADDFHGNIATCLTTFSFTPTIQCSPPVGFVAVLPGTFEMGSNASPNAPYWNGYYQQPVHQVTITHPFWIGEAEVTQGEFQSLMGFNPSLYIGDPLRPVEFVTWDDARSYCAAKTAQELAAGNVPAGYEFRLPTEAEWEYACRAGTTTEFSTGIALYCADATINYSNHASPSCTTFATTPVKTYLPNPWGLYDVHGNVGEWCLDAFSSYTSSPKIDPLVTTGYYRVWRGGSLGDASSGCRSAARTYHNPSGAQYIGFRVVLGPSRQL